MITGKKVGPKSFAVNMVIRSISRQLSQRALVAKRGNPVWFLVSGKAVREDS